MREVGCGRRGAIASVDQQPVVTLGCVGVTLGCVGVTLGCVGVTLGCVGVPLGCVGVTLGCIKVTLGCVGSWEYFCERGTPVDQPLRREVVPGVGEGCGKVGGGNNGLPKVISCFGPS